MRAQTVQTRFAAVTAGETFSPWPTGRLVDAQPRDACAELRLVPPAAGAANGTAPMNSTEGGADGARLAAGAILLVDRGGCSFVHKVRMLLLLVLLGVAQGAASPGGPGS